MRCIRRGFPSSTTCIKTLITVSAMLLIYGEIIIYCLHANNWKSLPSTNKNKSIRILLVSDPQIQGYEYEPFFPLGIITRWDSDSSLVNERNVETALTLVHKYLSKTFSLALKHTQPEMIIFLGDLMDEGSIASDEVFASYVKRFFNLFAAKGVLKLYIPGDNDIGGEGDKVTDHKVDRFRHAFHDDVHIIYKFAEFARVNYFTREAEKTNLRSNKKRILITHFPLLPVSKIFGKEIITKTGPDLIFSAHDHSSIHFVGEKNGTFVKQENFGFFYQIWTLNLNKTLHEILVPTCSYRMGKRNIGYGFAIIENNGSLQYTILWLPDRYLYLFLYVKMIFIFLFCIVVKLLKTRIYG